MDGMADPGHSKNGGRGSDLESGRAGESGERLVKARGKPGEVRRKLGKVGEVGKGGEVQGS